MGNNMLDTHGVECKDKSLIRLISIIALSFIARITDDASQHAKLTTHSQQNTKYYFSESNVLNENNEIIQKNQSKKRKEFKKEKKFLTSTCKKSKLNLELSNLKHVLPLSGIE